MNDEILNKIYGLIAGPVNEANVQHLFTLARKLIDRAPKGDRKHFPLLKFYCDWTMHPDVDRSPAGAWILADAHNIIADHLGKKDNTTLMVDLTAALSLNNVRDQLNNLFAYFGGPSAIDEAKWAAIVPVVAEIIAHCPLTIDPKNRQLASALKAIRSRPLRGTSVVEELMVIKVPSNTLNPQAAPNEITYCISLKTTDTVRFVSPLLRT